MTIESSSSPSTPTSYQLNCVQTDTTLSLQRTLSIQSFHGGGLQSWLRVLGYALLLVMVATISLLQLQRFTGNHHSFTLNNIPASEQGGHPTEASVSRQTDGITGQVTPSKTAITIIPPSKLLVQPGDYVYLRNDWDAAPVVIEKYKLIFFTIPKSGCTVWKLLFRRIMGYADWQSVDWTTMLPHQPERNGLKYLYDFTMEEASFMLTSPQYTKAIFVRDPKERLLSAFLDKAMRNNGDYLRSRCCYLLGQCVPNALASLEGFMNLTASCDDIHWRPQGRRMEPKYWPYVNFVGHLETAQVDAKRLLQSLSDGKTTAWEEYGASGWGPLGNQAMFDSADGRAHDTDADSKVQQYYTSLRFEERVEQFYLSDYTNPKLNIPLVRINH